MKKIKILVTSVLAGSGHNSAADLLADQLKADKRFEVVRYINPSKSLDNTYNNMTKYSPFVHNFFINHAPGITGDVIMLGEIHFVSDALEVLKKEQPDIVLSTHFIIAHSFKIAEWILGRFPININAFPDYGDQPRAGVPANIFIRPEYAIVYNKTAYDSFKGLSGIRNKYLWLGGHTCKNDFKQAAVRYSSKEQAREKLKALFPGHPYDQLSTGKKTILIAGGGGGIIQKTYKLLKAIAARQKEDISLLDKYQFVVICGQNHKYYEKVMKVRSTKLSWQNIFPFGWLDSSKYALLQRASDYPVLFGIAPATMHELLQTECGPLLMHRIRADQELGNVQFVETTRLGKFEADVELAVEKIFNPPSAERVERFEARAEKLLAEEEARLAELPDKLVEAYNQKQYNANEIYRVSWLQKLVSNIFVPVTVLFYFGWSVIRRINIVLAAIHDLLKKFKDWLFPSKQTSQNIN